MKVTYEHSGFAPSRVVREVERLLPGVVEEVEKVMRGRTPQLKVTVSGPAGIATMYVLALGPAKLKIRARLWRETRQSAKGFGLTALSKDGWVLIGLNGKVLDRNPGEILPTLRHEVTHAIQLTRPVNRKADWEDTEVSLDRRAIPSSRKETHGVLFAIMEAEARSVESLLSGNRAGSVGFGEIRQALAHWDETLGGTT